MARLALALVLVVHGENQSNLCNETARRELVPEHIEPCWAVREGNVSLLTRALETESVLRHIDFRICMGKWVRCALLHKAAVLGHLESASLLVSKGARVDVEDGDGLTPFAIAATQGFLVTAQFFLENFADVDHVSLTGQTALMLASRAGSVRICRWLLSNGASARKRDVYGNTALLLAVQQGHLGVVQLLLQKGLSIEDADDRGWTPLVWAVKAGHEALAQELLSLGASVTASDHDGNSPLLWPLKAGNLPMAKLLLDHGADVYRLTADGMPTYMASGSVEVNAYMIRSRWWAFFFNPLAALSLLGGCLLGAAAAYVQLNHAALLPAYDLVAKDPNEAPEKCATPSGRVDSSSEPVDRKDYLWPQFYHGAFLKAAESTSLQRYALILEVEVTAVAFGFGLVVVWWIIWLPLHVLTFAPGVYHYKAALFKEPALLVAKRLPGLVLMCRVMVLWTILVLAARPSCHQKFPAFCSWANDLCLVEGGDSSSWHLSDPQWPQMLMKQMTWKRQDVSSITGIYLLGLGLSFLAYLISLAEHSYQKKRLSVEVSRILRTLHQDDSNSSQSPALVRDFQSFRQKLRLEVLLLLLDAALHVNTVFILLWTGYFVLAFLLAMVVARSIALHFLLGRLQKLPEALQESERYGMVRKDLLEVMAEHRGCEAFLALCLTSYSYWYCVENAYHAMTLLTSLVLSTTNVAEHLHQRIDFEMDLDTTPQTEMPKDWSPRA